jgi:hypothetical protein
VLLLAARIIEVLRGVDAGAGSKDFEILAVPTPFDELRARA